MFSGLCVRGHLSPAKALFDASAKEGTEERSKDRKSPRVPAPRGQAEPSRFCSPISLRLQPRCWGGSGGPCDGGLGGEGKNENEDKKNEGNEFLSEVRWQRTAARCRPRAVRPRRPRARCGARGTTAAVPIPQRRSLHLLERFHPEREINERGRREGEGPGPGGLREPAAPGPARQTPAERCAERRSTDPSPLCAGVRHPAGFRGPAQGWGQRNPRVKALQSPPLATVRSSASASRPRCHPLQHRVPHAPQRGGEALRAPRPPS